MEGCGTRRDRDRMLRADEHGEIFFERIEIGPGRGNPIGLESFQDEFDFCGTDVGWREVKSIWFHKGEGKFRVAAIGRRVTNFRSRVSATRSQVRVLQVRVRVREATTLWGLIPRGCPAWHCITGKGEWRGMSSNYVPLKVLGLGKVLSESVFVATNDRRFQREVTLKNQLRRAALSIPSNIAEGDARGYSQEGIRFFKIAIASAEETKVQLELAGKMGFIDLQLAQSLFNDASVICRMLNKLIESRIKRGSSLG